MTPSPDDVEPAPPRNATLLVAGVDWDEALRVALANRPAVMGPTDEGGFEVWRLGAVRGGGR